MNRQQALALGSFVRATRRAKHLAACELAKPAGVDTAQILRLERGEVAAPRMSVLKGIAIRLRIPVSDILALADYPLARQLPSIEPYLRSRYPQLATDDITLLSELLANLLARAKPAVPADTTVDDEGERS